MNCDIPKENTLKLSYLYVKYSVSDRQPEFCTFIVLISCIGSGLSFGSGTMLNLYD